MNIFIDVIFCQLTLSVHNHCRGSTNTAQTSCDACGRARFPPSQCHPLDGRLGENKRSIFCASLCWCCVSLHFSERIGRVQSPTFVFLDKLTGFNSLGVTRRRTLIAQESSTFSVSLFIFDANAAAVRVYCVHRQKGKQ